MDVYKRKYCLLIFSVLTLLITGCSTLFQKTVIKEIKPEGIRESSLGNIKLKYDVALYSGPEWSGELLGEIDREVILKAVCETDNWILVETPDEMTGWVGRSWIGHERLVTNINLKHKAFLLSEPGCLSELGRLTQCPNKTIDLVLPINEEELLEVVSETEDWVLVRANNPDTNEPETGWIARTWVDKEATYDCDNHPSATRTYYSEHVDRNSWQYHYFSSYGVSSSFHSKKNSSTYSKLNAAMDGVETFFQFVKVLDGFSKVMLLEGLN